MCARRFGLSFIGNPWKEQTLIGLAYAYEQRTQWRRKGKMYVAPTTEITGQQQAVVTVTATP